jgi:hypothetical protein
VGHRCVDLCRPARLCETDDDGKTSQSPGIPHWQRTGKVCVVSGEYETSVLETNVVYLLIRADDLVHRHAGASDEQATRR